MAAHEDDDPVPALLPRDWPALVDEVTDDAVMVKTLIDRWVLDAVIEGEVPPGPRDLGGEPCE